jgi:hypothetical protein
MIRSTLVAALAALGLLVPSIGRAAPPSCVAACEGVDDCCGAQPCIRRPCENYLGCKAQAQTDLETCIDTQPGCKPGPGGRCTIILGCVRACERDYKIDVKACRKNFLSNTNADNPDPCAEECVLKPKGQKKLAKICESCTSVTVTTTTVTTTSTVTSTSTTTLGSSTTAAALVVQTTTESLVPDEGDPPVTGAAEGDDDFIDRCMRGCLSRIDSLDKDYGRCDDACDGNARALSICQRASRNFACKAIKARCSTDGDNRDEAYRSCCRRRDTCLTKEEAPCKITSTTTSTTTTSTTTVTTTTNTTTTTSPPFPS